MAAAVFALAWQDAPAPAPAPAPAQETPPPAEQPQDPEQPQQIDFDFTDAPADAVFQYVTRATGHTIVNMDSFHGRLSMHARTERDIDHVIAALDEALRGQDHAAVRRGEFIVVLTVDHARQQAPEIVPVRAVEDVPMTDEIKTFLITLRNLSAVDAERELRSLFPQGAQVATNRHSNSIVITDAGINVQRIAQILFILDVQSNQNLDIHVFALQHSSADQMVNLINQLFLQQQQQEEDSGGMGGWGRILRMFARQGQPEENASQGTPAGSIVRVAPDHRTNSVIVASTPENIELIGSLIRELDMETPEATRIAVYALRYADATEASRLINDVFAEPGGSSSSSSGGQNRGGGGGGMRAWWMGMMPQAQGGQEAATSGISVRALPDTRTNSVIVTAGEQQLPLVEQLVTELDRQVSDVVRLKVYVLENADATEMARIIKETLAPAQAAASGRTGAAGAQNMPRWAQQIFGGAQQQSTSSASTFAQMEVTADTRTNSIIVKASEDYIAVVDQLVEQLDSNSTEEVSTFVVPLRHGSAVNVAETLRALTGQGQSRLSQQYQSQQNQRTQQQGFGSFFGNNQQGGNRNNQQGGNRNGQNQFGNFRFPQMTPQDSQDPQQPETPEEELMRLLQEQQGGQGQPSTNLQGQLDIEPDPDTNSLVVRTSPRNMDAIRGLLSDLDKPRPQVMIRVLIADVTLDDAMSLGLEATWRTESPFGDLAVSSDFEDLNQTNVGQGAFLFQVTGDHVDATLNALARSGSAEILATPRILVLNNQNANVVVGSQVPLVDSSRIDQATGATVNTIRYQQIGIILDVTPTINPDGLVTLQVHPEVSDLDETRQVPISSTATAPAITNNSADTTVTVRHGQTVIIGGLIREQDQSVRQRIPILGDIPILGLLFGKQDTVTRRRELMIFLTPYVVYTQPQLEELSALERARLRLIDERDIPEEIQRWHGFIRD